jgi:hypothetical protein
MQHRNDALICAAVLDGKGGARELSWDDIDRWQPADGVLWRRVKQRCTLPASYPRAADAGR